MITLRDGSKTVRPQLDRLIQEDERNLQYPATGLLTAANKTRSYTWSVEDKQDSDVRLDQGVQGACVGFCWTHELIARPAEWEFTVPMINPDPIAAAEAFARSVYYDSQKRDPWPGGEYPGAVPTMQGTSVIACASVLKDLGYIKEYRWVWNIADLARAVGHIGPAILGTRWYQNMDEPGRDGLLDIGGQEVGGHCILINGVSMKGKYFKLVNSWGAGWGDKGSCRIKFDDMQTLLTRQGEACIPIGRATQKGTTK